MQFFHLEQPLDEMIVCDWNGCEAIADYLEVEDDGTEQRLCAFHTRSYKYASRLPVRAPNRRVPYRSAPLALPCAAELLFRYCTILSDNQAHASRARKDWTAHSTSDRRHPREY